ncbi:hypothetical protein ACTMU2_17355 [Cupriavidus basilensis]
MLVVLAKDLANRGADNPQCHLTLQEIALLLDDDDGLEACGEFAEEFAVSGTEQADLSETDPVGMQRRSVETEVFQGLLGVGPALSGADDSNAIPGR